MSEFARQETSADAPQEVALENSSIEENALVDVLAVETAKIALTSEESNEEANIIVASIQTEEPQEKAPVVEQPVIVHAPFVKVQKVKSLADRQTDHLSAGISFDDPTLNIPKSILDALTLDLRFEKPSQIQAVTIPRIRKGRNIIAQAQTGSGKTIAFAIGMLAAVDVSVASVQALCLTPTRELASQIVSDAIIPLSRYITGLRYELLVPDDHGSQTSARSATCTSHIIVGTPGTIKTLISRRYLARLKQTVRIFVCDEADEMVDTRALGQETVSIKQALAEDVQTLFFSATFPDVVLEFARKLVSKACVVKLRTNEALVLESIFQVRINVANRPSTGENKKLQVLKDIYGYFGIEQSIIFVNSRDDAENVARMFAEESYSVSFLHGRLAPSQRDEEMRKFREGETIVLVTTNVLSRGVDVPAVDVIVNFDLPRKPGVQRADALTYLHRIGRCGRFGRPGTAITLMESAVDERLLEGVEEYFSGGGGGEGVSSGASDGKRKRMTTEWDCNLIDTLADEVRGRAAVGAGAEAVVLDCAIEVSDE